MRSILLKFISGTLILLFCNTCSAQLEGFTLTGNPQSVSGATRTYQHTDNGIYYDLRGILFKPSGAGLLPAVIINHGTGGSSNSYSKVVAQKMVTWGYVCIAVNYTHSGGVPCGSPGECVESEFGASVNNILRGMKCWDILASLSYVDTNCIAAFGHSRGAFLTTAMVGVYPQKFSAAGHTAGGVSDQPGATAPTSAMANGITAPYIIHHGDSDLTVNIGMDRKLDSILTRNGVLHQFHIYQGYTHSQISFDTLMYSRTKQWFQTYICKTSGIGSTSTTASTNNISVYPNPAVNHIDIVFDSPVFTKADVVIYDLTGREIIRKNIAFHGVNLFEMGMKGLPSGVYFFSMKTEKQLFTTKIVIMK